MPCCDQYLLCPLYFRICSFFGQRDLGSLHIQELWKKFRSLQLIFALELYFIFAPYVYIELPLGSSRTELNFSVIRFWLHVHKGAMTFRSIQSIFVCWGCILVSASCVYIELPVGSSSWELHFFAMGFGILIHLRAMTKFPEV